MLYHICRSGFQIRPCRFLILWIGLLLLLAGCRTPETVVPTPTIAVIPSDTPTPQITVTEQGTPSITPTAPPTWTPRPTTRPFVPSVTPVDTLRQTAQAPIPTQVTGNNVTLDITESQLNAALARSYNASPLSRYTAAPRVVLADNALIMTLSIIPTAEPLESRPQTMTMIGTFNVFNGTLELEPSDLSPQNVGVTTQQVKQAHQLLLRTLNDLVRRTLTQSNLTYTDATILPDKLTLIVQSKP